MNANNFRYGGNKGNIALAGGWRKKLHDKEYDLKLITKKDLLLCRILADIEKDKDIVNYNSKKKSSIDLRVFCTPVEYQYIYYTCTVFSLTGGIEFMNKRWSAVDYYLKKLNLRRRFDSLGKKEGYEWAKAIVDELKDVQKDVKKSSGLNKIVIQSQDDSDLLLSKLFAYKLADNTFQQEGPFIPFSAEPIINVIQEFGVCSEKYWPYVPTYTNPGLFYVAPPAFCYQEAKKTNSNGLLVLGLDEDDPVLAEEEGDFSKVINRLDKVFEIDKSPMTELGKPTVDRIRKILYNYHLPVVGSFYLYPSTFSSFLTSFTGFMPYPKKTDLAENGHCVLLVGYDDNIEIPSIIPGQNTSKGAFLFKNSWSTEWGNDGYGWLAYDYFAPSNDRAKKIATDFWAVYVPYPDMDVMDSKILNAVEKYVFSGKKD